MTNGNFTDGRAGQGIGKQSRTGAAGRLVPRPKFQIRGDYAWAPAGLEKVEASQTRRYLFGDLTPAPRIPRSPQGWLRLEGVTRNNLHQLSVDFPLGTLTTVTGVSGSGKSSLVSQALVELVGEHLGHAVPSDEDEENVLEASDTGRTEGRIIAGMDAIKRLVCVDQKSLTSLSMISIGIEGKLLFAGKDPYPVCQYHNR